MPRGNDPDAAKELRERYGANTGNAEALITANRARRDPQLRAAQLSAIDDSETAKLDVSKLDAPGKVLDAAVRGDYVTYVWEDDAGRLHHGVQPREGARSQRLADPEDIDAETAAAREEAARDAELQRLQAEADAKVEAATAKAHEQAAKDAQKAAQAAEKPSEPEASGGKAKQPDGK
jgi:hypothetical protein